IYSYESGEAGDPQAVTRLDNPVDGSSIGAWSYDESGHRVNALVHGFAPIDCTYAADGTLRELRSGETKVRIFYDRSGQRMAMIDSGGEWHVYLDGLLEVSGGGSESVARVYVPGSMELVGLFETKSGPRGSVTRTGFIHQSQSGNIDAI